MISTKTDIENAHFSNIKALGIKFDLGVKKVKDNPDPSFVQTW